MVIVRIIGFLLLCTLHVSCTCTSSERTAINDCLDTYTAADSNLQGELTLITLLSTTTPCGSASTDCSEYTKLIQCINGKAGSNIGATCMKTAVTELDTSLANVGYGCTFQGYGDKCPNLAVSLNIPVDGGWGNWASWSSCSATCEGNQLRNRSCDNPSPQHGGSSCTGNATETQGCNSNPCPIDGSWGAWSGWNQCDVTCGGGNQTRNRSCDNPAPAHGGLNCTGSNVTHTQACNTSPCPVNGSWSTWSTWGACTVSCGGGNQTRNRTCDNPVPQYGGYNCSGSEMENQVCNSNSCPINGNWSTWSTWGACSVSCGGGNQTRNRSCDNPSPQYGGFNCSGTELESQVCNSNSCPINGSWSSWSTWGTCSVSCGGGNQTRNRTCDNPAPQHGGHNCSGSELENQVCNSNGCPVNGSWSSWTTWGACSVSCGGGNQTRNRSCDNPAPQYGGFNCSGSEVENQVCNSNSCPINGNWSIWSTWGACSVSCGGGNQTRNRSCDNPAPQYGGFNCSGLETENQVCNSNSCPINGNWSTWSTWGACSVSCGGGNQTRNRSCDNPAPQYGGFNCSGSETENQVCNSNSCPINGNWSTWSTWGACSVSCGGGNQTRNRSCDNPAPQYGGFNCSGSETENQVCNSNSCSINGNWSTWSAWGACSVSCGGGNQTRNRSCDNPAPQYGGFNCSGSESESQVCNSNSCPIHGNWSTWSTWGACSVSCGGGNQTRNRTCDNPAPRYGGFNCSGTESDSQVCNSNSCLVYGGWSSWSSWEACSLSCGGGNQKRNRTCDNPAPQYGGLNCTGPEVEAQVCNSNVCPDGKSSWGTWSEYSTCSKTCGGGSRNRTRACENPSQTVSIGDANCLGDATETSTCNTNICPLSAEAEEHGVSITLGGGMTTSLFNNITAYFLEAVVNGTNRYCNYNSTQWAECCSSNRSYTPNASNPLTYTDTSLVDIAENYPLQITVDKIVVVIVLKANSNNSLCAAGGSRRRRKRAVSIGASQFAIPQDVLTAILSDSSTQSQLVTALKENLPPNSVVNITLEGVTIATQPTTAAAPTSTTMLATTQREATATIPTTPADITVAATVTPIATPAWLIAVAVVGGVIGIVLIIGLILLIKRHKKLISNDVAPLK